MITLYKSSIEDLWFRAQEVYTESKERYEQENKK